MALEQLGQFIGTERWYSHWTKLLTYTDGIKYVAEEAGAYWLIDLVASYQPKLKDIPFQLWVLSVDQETQSGTIYAVEDTGKPHLVEQELEYTSFPLKHFEFYCIDGVMLLKGEY